MYVWRNDAQHITTGNVVVGLGGVGLGWVGKEKGRSGWAFRVWWGVGDLGLWAPDSLPVSSLILTRFSLRTSLKHGSVVSFHSNKFK